jgi:hypothetical protein
MNTFKLAIVVLGISIFTTLHAQPQSKHEKLRRADCFFGVHFDLHASEDITDAGLTLTPEMVDTFLTRVQPDFIQIDCKGHPGISSYPTKVGYPVKGFEKDPLKIWRDVTEKDKVALFMHYSGVMDAKAVAEHPDWALIKANGDKSTTKISFFSPYPDKLMIPQLEELSSAYHVDGAWIDGDCWAVEPDYSLQAINEWKKRKGNIEVPSKPGDRYYPEYLEYTRDLFREYLRKYIDTIHKFNPEFQITSNWSFSSMMPEKVNIDVDFLSGDVTPQNGVYRSAFEARCLAPQGKPWDLMAWGFSWNGGQMPPNNKSVVQLEQEASEIMAMGGGVQFYFQQNKDLSLKPWLAGPLSELGTFCRQRQHDCHQAKALPQIALLFPTQSYRQHATSAFSGPPAKLPGMLYALLDNQYPVEVLTEYQLAGKMDQYPMIVIPECDYLDRSVINELRDYLENGGHLLVIGPQTAGLFAGELGIRSGDVIDETVTFLSAANRLGAIRSPLMQMRPTSDCSVLSHFYDVCDYRYKSKSIASTVRKVGKGKIAGIYFNAGTAYAQYKTFVIRDFIGETIDALGPDLRVKIGGSHLVHVALNKKNDKTYLNLINIGGEHTNTSAVGYDQVPPLVNLTIDVKSPTRPQSIVEYPSGKPLNFTWANGVSKLILPELDVYSILEINK